MQRFFAIVVNNLMELIRQPVFLLLISASSGMILFLAGMPYFGLGEDPKLVKDSALAVTFLTGLLGAVIGASTSLAHEVRQGTALAVLSKPVGKVAFLVAKFFGVAAALIVMTYVNLVAALQASRMVFDVYSGTDWPALLLFFGAMAMAYLLAAFANFFLERPFVQTAVILLVFLVSLAFWWTVRFTRHEVSAQEAAVVEWRIIPAGILILFAILILAGLALACATRLELVPTLTICTLFFLLGLISDYLFGRFAENGIWWAQGIYAVLPNWQLYWMSDALDLGRSIPPVYLARGFLQMILNLGMILGVAIWLFEGRELN